MRKIERIEQTIKKWVYTFLIILGLFTITFSLGIGVLMGYIRTLPPIEELENYAPPQITRILDVNGEVIGRFSRQNREVVPIKDMSTKLIDTFVAIEDERFYEHFGVDVKGVARAMLIDLIRMRAAQGASTITQQLPRNLLKRVSRRKALSRKIQETLLAFQIEKRYSKDQILEFYLNQIYLGNGAYGVEAAARTYFNKHAMSYKAMKEKGCLPDDTVSAEEAELTLAECAALAASIQKPSTVNPIRNPELATRRRDMILKTIYEKHLISSDTFDSATTSPIELRAPEPERNRAPYFIEYIRSNLAKEEEFAEDRLFQGGFVVQTMLDHEMQRIAQEELQEGLKSVEQKWQARKWERYWIEDEEIGYPPKPGQIRLAKIVSVYPHSVVVELPAYESETPIYRADITLPEAAPYFSPENVLKEGGLLDIVIDSVDPAATNMNATLYDTEHVQGAVVILDAHTGEIRAMVGGADYYDQENKGMWNRAVQMRRQPGSGLKPFIYACAFELGFSLGTIFIDEPIVFADGYTPKNFENEFFGPTTLQEALEHSRNVVTINLFQTIGYRKVIDFIKRFEIVEDYLTWTYANDITVALGNAGVTPLELTAAFVPFANKGVAVQPLGVRVVNDSEGKAVKRFRPLERVVLSPQGAYISTSVLQGVVKRGTGKYVIYDQIKDRKNIPEIAGKTGTTNDCVDCWFVGYTPDIVMGVYVGFDKIRTLGPQMTGAAVAAPIWRGILISLLKLDKERARAFEVPDGIVFKQICKKSGLLAKPSCEEDPDNYVYERMAFKKGTEPTSYCDVHN